MSVRRWILVAVLAVASGVWAVTALYVQRIRQDHKQLIATIRDSETAVPSKQVDAAIADYRQALRVLPCNASLHQEINLLIAQRTDRLLSSADVNTSADALDEMYAALSDTLACTPTDGKVWLDIAVISIHREGFNARALAAYKTSARVAPGESWLAEKRLYFALTFLPLLDAEARNIGQADITVLERAHPNRIHAVMNDAQVTSVDALRALLTSSEETNP